MPKTEIIFKPKYNGSMRFAFYLWPVWLGLSGYFIYRMVVQHSYNPDALLAFIFIIMTVTMPFRVLKEIRFGGKEITAKRYLLPDLVIPYDDVLSFRVYELTAKNARLSLYMASYDSLQEFEKILQQLMSERKIKLVKKR